MASDEEFPSNASSGSSGDEGLDSDASAAAAAAAAEAKSKKKKKKKQQEHKKAAKSTSSSSDSSSSDDSSSSSSESDDGALAAALARSKKAAKKGGESGRKKAGATKPKAAKGPKVPRVPWPKGHKEPKKASALTMKALRANPRCFYVLVQACKSDWLARPNRLDSTGETDLHSTTPPLQPPSSHTQSSTPTWSPPRTPRTP